MPSELLTAPSPGAAATAEEVDPARALRAAAQAGPQYGRSDDGAGRRALVEFVSANPNGPVTVGHGRGGAVGDALASLLSWAGWRVEREFYVNDATNSKQMRVFARSVYARYRQFAGHDDPIPEDGYPGEYVTDLARAFRDERGDDLASAPAEEAVRTLQSFALERMLAEQRATLAAFGIEYDHWTSEEQLGAKGAVDEMLSALRAGGHTFEEGGALWLRSSALGDENDRTLVRSDGTPTYLAGDLAYHRDKFARGFDLAVDVWNADHAGYVARTKAGLAALGYAPERLHVALCERVRLLQDGTELLAGRRTGGAVALDELLTAVGRDAARFHLLLLAPEAPLDLDTDLAKRRDRSNPLYAVQSAHARCASLLWAAGDAAAKAAASGAPASFGDPLEEGLAARVGAFPAEVAVAARHFAPHRIARYALDLALALHGYLDRTASGTGTAGNADARLALVGGARHALANALSILGVSAPERL